jgi:hypothetical protein
VLAVVQHEQCRTVSEVFAHSLQTIAASALHTQRLCYSIAYELRLRNGREFAEPDAIWAVRLEFFSQPEGQPGFSDTTCARHCDQAIGGYKVEQSAKFQISAYEARELRREVAPRFGAWH